MIKICIDNSIIIMVNAIPPQMNAVVNLVLCFIKYNTLDSPPDHA